MKKKKSCRGCERELRRECFSPSKRPKKKKKKKKNFTLVVGREQRARETRSEL